MAPEPTLPPSSRLNRRQFLQISAATAGALLVGARRWARPGTAEVRETRVLMGTVVNLALVAPDATAGRAAATAVFGEMERLIHLFDHRRPDGPLGRLNRAGRLDPAPPELLDLLAHSRHFGELTGGAFDVTVKPLLDALAAGASLPAVPVDYGQVRIARGAVFLARPGMAVTLDGIAKGRVVDAAVSVLKARGFSRVLVEAGGDLFGSGANGDGRPWRLGLQHPRTPGASLATFTVSSCAAATSGDYANYFDADYAWHHILDPQRRRSPAELASATVLAPTATAADALSTATMVLGLRRGLALLGKLPQVEGLLVTRDMQLARTAGFPASGKRIE